MTARDLTSKNDYYRYFLSKLWFKIGDEEELIRVLENGQSSKIPEFDNFSNSSTLKYIKDSKSIGVNTKLRQELLWYDLQRWNHYNESDITLREWIEWKDGISIHTWDDSFQQGVADLTLFLGMQSQCFFDNCTIRIYLGDESRGIICIIYRNHLKIEFHKLVADDGCYYFDSLHKPLTSEKFIQFKVALMSEIAELKIPGFSHQKVQKELFGMNEFKFE